MGKKKIRKKRMTPLPKGLPFDGLLEILPGYFVNYIKMFRSHSAYLLAISMSRSILDIYEKEDVESFSKLKLVQVMVSRTVRR
jgi:hypothetical protein